MLTELFKLGPYSVCLWNLLMIGASFFGAFVLRKIIHRSLKKYLSSANIRLEGKRKTYLRLFSQSAYALAIYFSILSFNINNKDVSFQEFLAYDFIRTSKLHLSFENIIVIFLIVFGTRFLNNIIRLYLQRRFRSDRFTNIATEYIYMQVVKYITTILAFFLILNELGVNPSLFLGGSAALLVGLGLGLQDVFKDMFSGFVLLFEGSIRVGDVIEINDGKSSEPMVAKIIRIKVRTTQIETRDGNVLIVPNAKLTQEYIENWSHGSTLSRFQLRVTVSYGSDLELVRKILIQAAMSHPKVNKENRIDVRLIDFGENGLQMELIFWADQSWDINNYKSEIRFEIDRLFRHYGIRIPFPQRNVYVQSNENRNNNTVQ
jgi:small-conductance mechanosensitive channel